MPAIEPLCHLMSIKHSKLNREENFFLEAVLFTRLCEEIKECQRTELKNYFRLMKFTVEKENIVLEKHFVIFIMKDILSTEEYTLEGIALYTDTHKDVVEEIFSARNTNPSARFLGRLIELHCTIRRSLYLSLMKKIASEYCST